MGGSNHQCVEHLLPPHLKAVIRRPDVSAFFCFSLLCDLMKVRHSEPRLSSYTECFSESAVARLYKGHKGHVSGSD